MIRRIRSLVGLALCVLGAWLALVAPAGAQQLVDAGKDGDGSGGLAFVLMVVMVVIIGTGAPGDGSQAAGPGAPSLTQTATPACWVAPALGNSREILAPIKRRTSPV